MLGWRLGLNIPIDQIEDVMPARGLNTFVFLGIKFATSVRTTVLIKRARAMDVIISPDDPVGFIGGVRTAMDNYASGYT